MQSKAAARRIATTLTALIVLFVVAVSADAKMPGFETDVEVEGTIATVTVSIEVEGFDAPELEGIVAIYPTSAIDKTGGPDHSSRIDILLKRETYGLYQATVDLEEAGSWSAVSMPDWSLDPAFKEHVVSYPDPVYFKTGTGTTWGWVAGGAAAAFALGVLVWRPRSLWKPFLASVSVIDWFSLQPQPYRTTPRPPSNVL